jgi:predicted transcriptional regulator of viral defense system
MHAKGISAKNRALLAALHSSTSGPFAIDEAVEILGRPRAQTRQLLASLAAGGWLNRIRRGIYSAVPLGHEDDPNRFEDPWVVVSKVLAPEYYVGGWSACEHWGLTDQTFRTTMAFTTRKLRRREFTLGQMNYVAKRTSPSRLFGIREVPVGDVTVHASDPTRTVLDTLDSPRSSGGIRPTLEAVSEYFSGPFRNDRLLSDYSTRFGNRTVYKRLGFLIEVLGVESADLLAECSSRLSAGISLLDPDLPAEGPILSRWNLRINSASLAFGAGK